MGIGISHVFASNGIPTVLVDATPERSEAARSHAIALLSRLEQAGNVGGGTTATTEHHLAAAPSISDAVHGADLVVEAVLERPEVKLAVFAEIEPAAGDAVIATNTSSIPITELAAGLQRPERFLGVHWFVPPLLVPCVEVIRTPATAQPVVDPSRVGDRLRFPASSTRCVATPSDVRSRRSTLWVGCLGLFVLEPERVT
jgi:3-hydroxybutyryl-CoA dehydrogenase